MKLNKKIIIFTTLTILLLTSITGFAQDMSHHTNPSSLKTWFGVLEFPFLFVCVFFAFQTAKAFPKIISNKRNSGFDYEQD